VGRIEEKIEKYLVNRGNLNEMSMDLIGFPDTSTKKASPAYLIWQSISEASDERTGTDIVSIFHNKGTDSWEITTLYEDWGKTYIEDVRKTNKVAKTGKKVPIDKIFISPKGKRKGSMDIHMEAYLNKKIVFTIYQDNSDEYYPSVEFG